MGGQLRHDTTMDVTYRRLLLHILPLVLLLPALAVDGQLMASPLNCRKTCVCASNIISCSKANLTHVPLALPRYTAVLDLSFNAIARLHADWTTTKLSRLHSLLLANNGLTFLSSEAFVYVTRVRHLDLSSNGLKILEEFIFEPLEHLEVLLLYNNHISQIDRTAFSGLLRLQRLYLSHNQISRFPMELVKERSRLETLALLDVSFNRIKAMPLAELQGLPAWIKNSLFFHSNPLPCSCELYGVLARWHLQELTSATDFRNDHTCLLPGAQKEKAVILELTRVHLNCSEVTVTDREAFLHQHLVLDCDTRQRRMRKSWVLPGNVAVPNANHSALVRHDDSLQIGPLRAEDSGVYTCYATGDVANETLYVTVVVYNFTAGGGLEGMKTAYTTLAGCVASVIMVFVYLYLTPCHCLCCPGRGLSKGSPGDSLRSSTVSVAPHMLEEAAGGGGGGAMGGGGGGARALFNRHVAFLEPKDQMEQNGRLKPIGEEEEEEWQGDGRRRRKSDAESVSSVCSDTPMVV